MRHVEPPVQRALGALRAVRDQHAVGQREHRRGHRDLQLARRLLVRRVEAREPVPAVLVLALRPRLHRLVGIAVVGRREVEPAPRRRRGTRPRSRARRALGTSTRSFLPSWRKPAGLPLTLTFSISSSTASSSTTFVPVAITAQRSVAVPATVRLRRVDLEHERDVLDVDDAVGRVTRPGSGKRKLASHARVISSTSECANACRDPLPRLPGCSPSRSRTTAGRSRARRSRSRARPRPCRPRRASRTAGHRRRGSSPRASSCRRSAETSGNA